jgi:pyruvate formate lyase activating enzyme
MTAPHIEPQGILFDIQRLSLQDGPGIRTSLFFKGCPLRCLWCHNPESFTMGVQLQYSERLCVGCGACEAVCKQGVHTFQNKNGMLKHCVDHEKCNGCGDCLKVCCYDALKLMGTRYTVSELLKLIEGDKPYFSRPDALYHTGGITLTGGEPMMQFPFVKAFLKEKGDLHVCMETCGFAPTEHYREILPFVDLFLFDYKVSDPALHRELCGQDNLLILQNLEFLYAHGAKIVLRLPLISGVNDVDEHIKAISDLLKTHPNIDHGEIMAYHRLGVGKTELFGMKGMKVDLPNATQAQKEGWLFKFRELGVNNVILG